MKNRLIVFDLDDTLYPEREFVLSGFKAVSQWLRKQYGLEDFFGLAEAAYYKGIRGNIFNVVLDQMKVAWDTDLIKNLVRIYRTHTPSLKLFPDASQLLSDLGGREENTLGIITDGFLEAQHRKVTALNLKSRVDLVVYTDQWGRDYWKPHRRAFEHFNNLFPIPPKRCWYIADNPAKDFIAPNQMGWNTTHVVREDSEYGKTCANPEFAARQTVTDLSQIIFN